MHRAAALALSLATISCVGDEGSWRTANGEIAVSRVAAPAPANVGDRDSATMSVYATFANTGRDADTLVAVSSPMARSAALHGTVASGAMNTMIHASAVVIPAGGVARLAPGGTHVMLEGLDRLPVPGDTVPLTFTFRRAGPVLVNASVFPYDQLQKALEP